MDFPLVVAARTTLWLRCADSPLQRLLLLWSAGSAASPVVERGLCSARAAAAVPPGLRARVSSVGTWA